MLTVTGVVSVGRVFRWVVMVTVGITTDARPGQRMAVFGERYLPVHRTFPVHVGLVHSFVTMSLIGACTPPNFEPRVREYV